jgi:hypothetical protein
LLAAFTRRLFQGFNRARVVERRCKMFMKLKAREAGVESMDIKTPF